MLTDVLFPGLQNLVLAGADPLGHVLDQPFVGPFSRHMLMVTIVFGLLVTVFPFIVSRIKADGTGGRLATFFEVLLLWVRDDIAKPFLGKDTNKFLPVIWTFFMFILFCNMAGLIPTPKGSTTATANISVTAALALVSFVIYHVAGIKQNGLLKYLKANLLVGPVFLWPLMIVIEFAGHLIKPVALAIRLFANMVAGHLMLAVFVSFGAIGLLGAFPLNFLELLVAFIQAVVFTFLTTVFLSMALHPDH